MPCRLPAGVRLRHEHIRERTWRIPASGRPARNHRVVDPDGTASYWGAPKVKRGFGSSQNGFALDLAGFEVYVFGLSFRSVPEPTFHDLRWLCPVSDPPLNVCVRAVPGPFRTAPTVARSVPL